MTGYKPMPMDAETITIGNYRFIREEHPVWGETWRWLTVKPAPVKKNKNRRRHWARG